jgi:hypothetical protein
MAKLTVILEIPGGERIEIEPSEVVQETRPGIGQDAELILTVHVVPRQWEAIEQRIVDRYVERLRLLPPRDIT